MTVLLAVVGLVSGLALMVAKSLAIDQVRGQIQRRITADVEATIAGLPEELQEEWAEEWRTELAAIVSMPITAARFARGLHRSAQQLVADPALAPAGIADNRPHPAVRAARWRINNLRLSRLRRVAAGLSNALGYRSGRAAQTVVDVLRRIARVFDGVVTASGRLLDLVSTGLRALEPLSAISVRMALAVGAACVQLANALLSVVARRP